jgi:hypothetical protein
MKLINVPEINRWAKGTWVWNGKRFETLKEAKAFLDNAVLEAPLYTLITEYEGYDYIAHYDNEGIITSIVEIVPDKTPYLVWDETKTQPMEIFLWNYTKSRRVEFVNNGHGLRFKDKR